MCARACVYVRVLVMLVLELEACVLKAIHVRVTLLTRAHGIGGRERCAHAV